MEVELRCTLRTVKTLLWRMLNSLKASKELWFLNMGMCVPDIVIGYWKWGSLKWTRGHGYTCLSVLQIYDIYIFYWFLLYTETFLEYNDMITYNFDNARLEHLYFLNNQKVDLFSGVEASVDTWICLSCRTGRDRHHQFPVGREFSCIVKL